MMFGQNQPIDLNQPFAAPPAMGSFQPDPASQAAPQPFVWGAGGAQLTPDQLALRQKAALARTQGDYSPIASPWQGLARVAGQVEGALDLKSLDKDATAADAQRKQSIAELLGPGAGSSPVAAALTSDDPVAQKLGMAQWERDHPKPVVNDTVNDYNFRAQTLGQPAADDWLRRGNDPFISVNTPNGFYAGPQSGLAAAMQGAPAAAPTAPVGKLTPIQGGGVGNGAGGF